MVQVPGGREPTPLPSLRDMVSILAGLGPVPQWWPTNLRPNSPAEGSFVLALCQPIGRVPAFGLENTARGRAVGESF